MNSDFSLHCASFGGMLGFSDRLMYELRNEAKWLAHVSISMEEHYIVVRLGINAYGLESHLVQLISSVFSNNLGSISSV